MSDTPNVLIPAGTEITIQKAFDFLFSDIDEINNETEKMRIYSNEQTVLINALIRDIDLLYQHLRAAMQIIKAEDPELVKRTEESVEIYRRRLNAETEKENTK